MFVDSHCHLNMLNLEPFDGDLNQVLTACTKEKIEHMLCVSIDLENFPQVLALAQKYKNISASVGVHPNDSIANIVSANELINIVKQHPEIVAVGETGLDYFRSEENSYDQRQAFANHIVAAVETKKPLIIHTREAQQDTVDILRSENASQVGGVMHCFTEDWDMAKKAIDLNFYISFSGIVTFKNAQQIQEVASKVPLDRMLIETDSPYLAPVPFRGKPNFPMYVSKVAEFIAELRQEPLDEIARITTDNFYNLFNIKRTPL